MGKLVFDLVNGKIKKVIFSSFLEKLKKTFPPGPRLIIFVLPVQNKF